MANLTDTTTTKACTPLQINILKDSLKQSIDQETDVDLLEQCAALLSSDKDLYDLNRAISMDSLLAMVKEDIHSMFKNSRQ